MDKSAKNFIEIMKKITTRKPSKKSQMDNQLCTEESKIDSTDEVPGPSDQILPRLASVPGLVAQNKPLKAIQNTMDQSNNNNNIYMTFKNSDVHIGNTNIYKSENDNGNRSSEHETRFFKTTTIKGNCVIIKC